MLRTQSHAHGCWSRIGAGVGGRRLTGGAGEAPHREEKKRALQTPSGSLSLRYPKCLAVKGCRQAEFY